jgi:hypothetical protein
MLNLAISLTLILRRN